MKDSIIKKVIISSSTIIVLFIGWLILSSIKDNELVYPRIDQIFIKLIDCFKWENIQLLLSTFGRVLLSIIISLLITFLIIVLYIIYPNSYAFFSPLIKIMRTTPFICISLFIIIVFSANVAPYIIALLLILPLMTEGLKSGIDSIDRNIKDDLALLEINTFSKIKLVYLPLIMPTIILTLLQTFGLGFKVIIMGEYFAQTKNSLGLALYTAKSFVNMDEVLAWSILIVIIVSIIELLINIFSEKRNKIIY